jgi:hypothetical protein
VNVFPVSSSSGSVGGFAGVVRRIRKVRSTCICVATHPRIGPTAEEEDAEEIVNLFDFFHSILLSV